jgi:hypothetical protein
MDSAPMKKERRAGCIASQGGSGERARFPETFWQIPSGFVQPPRWHRLSRPTFQQAPSRSTCPRRVSGSPLTRPLATLG